MVDLVCMHMYVHVCGVVVLELGDDQLLHSLIGLCHQISRGRLRLHLLLQARRLLSYLQ